MERDAYASTGSMMCFECRDLGHKKFICPHRAQDTEHEEAGPSWVRAERQAGVSHSKKQSDTARGQDIDQSTARDNVLNKVNRQVGEQGAVNRWMTKRKVNN